MISPKMRAVICIFVLAILISATGCKSEREDALIQRQKKVLFGIEVFLEEHLDLVKGKRVGLITNPTGVDSQLRSTIELFYKNPDIHLVALYGPEHGVR